jgi:hypothetical protein
MSKFRKLHDDLEVWYCLDAVRNGLITRKMHDELVENINKISKDGNILKLQYNEAKYFTVLDPNTFMHKLTDEDKLFEEKDKINCEDMCPNYNLFSESCDEYMQCCKYRWRNTILKWENYSKKYKVANHFYHLLREQNQPLYNFQRLYSP